MAALFDLLKAGWYLEKMKHDLKNMSFLEIEEFVSALGEKPYRARQIIEWVFEKRASSISEMTTLSKTFREELEKSVSISHIKLKRLFTSSDGTRKFLFSLSDGVIIESVLISEKERSTLCVSTQAGCKMGCLFCLTGKGEFIRDLTQAEILDQLIQVEKSCKDNGKVTNIVFMGAGEPLDNYQNLLAAIRIMLAQKGMKIPGRKITISTAGVVPRIYDLSGEGLNVKLAVSLNASNDEVRSRLMPINRRYPLALLMKALREYSDKRKKFVMFEYVMIRGLNDAPEDARRLVSLIKGVKCKVNLIPFNSYSASGLCSPDQSTVDSFHSYLTGKGIITLTRKSKGGDISAACGQLKSLYENGTTHSS